jgi:hypothetical protein
MGVPPLRRLIEHLAIPADCDEAKEVWHGLGCLFVDTSHLFYGLYASPLLPREMVRMLNKMNTLPFTYEELDQFVQHIIKLFLEKVQSL